MVYQMVKVAHSINKAFTAFVEMMIAGTQHSH
jgi:hypothetical protein